MSCLNGIDSFRLSETDFLTPFRPKLLKAGNKTSVVPNFLEELEKLDSRRNRRNRRKLENGKHLNFKLIYFLNTN